MRLYERREAGQSGPQLEPWLGCQRAGRAHGWADLLCGHQLSNWWNCGRGWLRCGYCRRRELYRRWKAGGCWWWTNHLFLPTLWTLLGWEHKLERWTCLVFRLKLGPIITSIYQKKKDFQFQLYMFSCGS